MPENHSRNDGAERARHLRGLAEATCRLADEADCPGIIEDYLRIAAKLVAAAERLEAGQPER